MLLDPASDAFQGSGQVIGLGSACLRQIGAPSPFAAHLLSYKINEFARLEPCCQIAGYACDQLDFPIFNGSQHCHAGFEFILEIVRCFTQRFRVCLFKAYRQYFDTFYLTNPISNIVTL